MPEVRIDEVTPPADVLDYFRGKQLAPRFSWLDVWGEEHAHAFTVAKIVEADVLAAYRATIDQALSEGLTFNAWRDRLEPRLRSLGWWGKRSVVDRETGERAKIDTSSPRRLQTTFWSNMRSARAAGQWERAQQTKAVLPYLLYVRTTAAEPRPEHLAFAGIVLPIDHVFWKSHYPPNGWGCKCGVRQVGRVEASRLGGVSADPVVRMVPFRNRRTGEVVQVPEGIDPGWQSNPGIGRGRKLGAILAERIGNIPDAPLRANMIERIVSAPEFDRLASGRGPKGTGLPVAEVPDAVRPAGAKASVALLSAETVRSHARYGWTSAQLTGLQSFVRAPREVIREPAATHVIGEFGGSLWDLVLKRTAAGDEIYVATLHRIDAKRLARLRQRAGRQGG